MFIAPVLPGEAEPLVRKVFAIVGFETPCLLPELLSELVFVELLGCTLLLEPAGPRLKTTTLLEVLVWPTWS